MDFSRAQKGETVATVSAGTEDRGNEDKNNPFQFFDQIYVVNLDRDVDRMRRVATRLSRLGITYNRFPALAAERSLLPLGKLTAGHYAVARSHKAVLERAFECGCQRVLIFEDDVVLRDDTAEWMRTLVPQLSSLPWDIFFFGLRLDEDGGRVAENLSRVKKSFHAHAYAVQREAIGRVVSFIDESLVRQFNFDCFEDSKLERVYANPILAIQEPSFSRILGRFVDRRCEYFPPFEEEDFLAHCEEARSWKPLGQSGAHAVLLQQATELHRKGKFKEARKIYEAILEEDSENPEAIHYLGLIRHQQGDGAAALELLYRSVAARPESAEFLSNLGMVLGQAGQSKQALEALDEALELEPDYPEALDNRGLVLEKLGKPEEAIADLRRAIELNPQFAAPHNHVGRMLLTRGQAELAIEHLRKAIQLNPKSAEAHNNLGCALRKNGELGPAIVAFRKSIHLRSGIFEVFGNLGNALMEAGRLEEAIDAFSRAVELKPDYKEGHWNLAIAFLATGDWERGWLKYEWRRHVHAEKMQTRTFLQPQWNGCSLAGQTILVLAEQGLGDTIQFIRYVPMIAERGAKVIVECQPTLRELLSNVKGISQLITVGDPIPPFDTFVSLLSLPGIFQTRLGNVPANTPYLDPDPQREAEWKHRIGGRGFKIGIAWQGSPTFTSDKTRSIPLSEFEPIAKVPGVQLFSLQKNEGTEQIAQVADRFIVEQFSPVLDEGTGAFMDTAAVMRHLDLVITSDTAVAHLAGALGVKVWVALRLDCDWRWLRDRDDSPWYPTMRLFRQQAGGDWADVFRRMSQALADTLAQPDEAEASPVMAPMAPGELMDRITILQIKNQRLQDPMKLRTVRTELDALAAVREQTLPRSEQLDVLVRELRNVNETLWQIEDDIRASENAGDFGPRFIELARSVYRTNDRRADLKKRINALLGSVIRDEKCYQAYRQ